MARIDRSRFVTGAALGGLQIEVGLSGHSVIDYDRKPLRRALTGGAGLVRKEARRLVSRRAISGAGEIPGMQSGALRRAIGVVSRGSKGGWIKIGVKTIPNEFFYPAPLFYGSKKNNLAPRANYIEKALDAKRESVRSLMRGALKDSLKPR